MQLVSLLLDEPTNLGDEPIADVLRRAVQADDASHPVIWRLLGLVSFLESYMPSVRLCALYLPNPPRLTIHGPNKASVILWVDYYDRCDVDVPSGLHFRLQIAREGSQLTRDVRTIELDEVARQIRVAFSLRET